MPTLKPNTITNYLAKPSLEIYKSTLETILSAESKDEALENLNLVKKEHQEYFNPTLNAQDQAGETGILAGGAVGFVADVAFQQATGIPSPFYQTVAMTLFGSFCCGCFGVMKKEVELTELRMAPQHYGLLKFLEVAKTRYSAFVYEEKLQKEKNNLVDCKHPSDEGLRKRISRLA
jgi:hypothetical protein